VAVHRAPKEGLRGRQAEREVAAAGEDDLCGSVLARKRLPLRLSEHNGGAALHDRELLGGDCLTRRAEHLGVLQRDVRHHLDRRTENVGRIVPPTETRLDNRHVDTCCRKLCEGCGGEHLELRRVETLGFGAHARNRRFEVSLFTAHTDPLAPPAHVGRDVRADGHTGVGEQRLDRASDGRLAVRPDHVNGRIAKLGVAEPGEERLDPLEPEAVLRPGAQRLNKVNC